MSKRSRAITKVVDTFEAAKFFTHAINVDHLNPFVAGEKSLAQAAAELGISKNRMNYWVNKLLELNLIHTVRVEKRDRHHVTIYQATADVFIVPVALLPTDSDEDIFQLATFEQKVKRSLADFRNAHMKDWLLCYELFNGMALLKIEPPENRSEELKVVNSWGQLNLSEKQAEAFRRDLERVLKKYAKEAQSSQGRSFLYKIILVEEELE